MADSYGNTVKLPPPKQFSHVLSNSLSSEGTLGGVPWVPEVSHVPTVSIPNSVQQIMKYNKLVKDIGYSLSKDREIE